MNKTWLKEYFDLYKTQLLNKDVFAQLLELKSMLETVHKKNGKTMAMGNGASASIASHISTDLSKGANIRTINFNDANLITALSNDYGYENWMAKAIELYGDSGDIVILVSSSGQSKNVIKAASTAKKIDIKVVTFSGFMVDNPLKNCGDLNFWVDSKAYNIIENIHMIWLTAVCDAIIGKAEYSAS
jgi:D-sedoheptulose 7-phosphate isomerase